MKYVYLDIETTNTTPCSGIWEIGCVTSADDPYFDNSFYMQCRPSGSISKSTMDWIYSKPDVAKRYEEALKSKFSQEEALSSLSDFLKVSPDLRDRNKSTFYSWGSFDFIILKHHMINIP